MEEVLFKDKKYLTGVLTGFILTAIILTGFNRYQQEKQEEAVPEEGRENSVSLDLNSVEDGEIIQNEGDTVGYREVSTKETMTPETPHSPELQRLALILREAERMLDRMEENINEVKETQTASIIETQR